MQFTKKLTAALVVAAALGAGAAPSASAAPGGGADTVKPAKGAMADEATRVENWLSILRNVGLI